MLTAGELAGMRAASLSALPDECRITRPAGPPVLDPATGGLVSPDPVVVFEGPCRLRRGGISEENTRAGDLHLTLSGYQATLPHDCTVEVDDYLEVTVSSDEGLVGRSFQVRHVSWSSYQVDRRVQLEDREQIGAVSSGDETGGDGGAP